MDFLKATITLAWDSMTPEYLVKTCRAFKVRVEKVIEAAAEDWTDDGFGRLVLDQLELGPHDECPN